MERPVRPSSISTHSNGRFPCNFAPRAAKEMPDESWRGGIVKWQYAVAIVVASLFIFLPYASADNGAAARGLETLIAEAVANNPELKAQQGRVDALGERPSQESSLDNPRLGFGLMNLPVNSFSFAQEPMTQKQVTLMQRLPFPGKLPLKRDIAGKDVDIAREQYLEKRNDLIMQVKVTYRNLLLINKTIAVTKDNRDLLREFVKTAETRYAVGIGIQQDVLKARVELSKMIDMLITQQEKKESLVARLNSLLYRPPDTEVKEIEGLDMESLAPTPFAYGVDELDKIALENRPVLIGAKRLTEKSQLAVSLARKNYYPDFDVGVSYGQRVDRPDFVSGFVTVSIPLWHRTKEDRKVAEERANVRQAEEQYNSLQNEIFFWLKDAVLKIRKYNDQVDLFKTGLIPQGRAALESAISGYSVNKVDFITLIDNQITLYNYQIDYYRALTDYENTLAGIEAMVGERLF
jgi:cobalt-zinc-cadmium efflux system outer membrane protein